MAGIRIRFRTAGPLTAGILCCLFLSACGVDTTCEADSAGVKDQRYTETIVGPLDTVTRLTAYCADQAAFDGYVTKTRELLERMDGIFDRYAAEGTVRRVNESAGKGPVPADASMKKRRA